MLSYMANATPDSLALIKRYRETLNGYRAAMRKLLFEQEKASRRKK
jgi:hypothetical protein